MAGLARLAGGSAPGMTIGVCAARHAPDPWWRCGYPAHPAEGQPPDSTCEGMPGCDSACGPVQALLQSRPCRIPPRIPCAAAIVRVWLKNSQRCVRPRPAARATAAPSHLTSRASGASRAWTRCSNRPWQRRRKPAVGAGSRRCRRRCRVSRAKTSAFAKTAAKSSGGVGWILTRRCAAASLAPASHPWRRRVPERQTCGHKPPANEGRHGSGGGGAQTLQQRRGIGPALPHLLAALPL